MAGNKEVVKAGLRDYHDVPFPEGTQPATGEWTVYSVMKLRQKHWHEEDKNNAVAIAHNVALADERTRSRTFSGKVIEFQQQLAAEREKMQTLVDALLEVNSLARGNMTGCGTCHHVIDATIKALAKVGGGEKK